MYTTSAAFKAAMAQPSRELTAKGTITFPDASMYSLTAAEIARFTVSEDAGDHLPLGGVAASTVSLVLDNRQGEWDAGGAILGAKSLDGAIVELEIGVLDGVAYEYANAGVFVIESPVAQEQEGTIEINGSDYLGNRAITAFADTLTYPQTVLQIVTEACLQANITIKTTDFVNHDVSIPEAPLWDEKTTCRDVISFVACLAGGLARIDRGGELEIISFANQASGLYSQLLDSSFEIVDGELIWTYPDGYTGPEITLVGSDLYIDAENIARLNDGELEFIGSYDGTNYYVHPNRYKKLTTQGVMFGPFNALSVYEKGAPDEYGATRIADDIDIEDNELNSVAVGDNPLLAHGSAALAELMENMLNSLSALEYYATSIEWQGDPSITCGDMLTISNLKSEAYNVLVLKQTLSFGMGFAMSTGNRLNTNVVGKAKTEYLRVFTPTGKLNAAALDGDINIRAGRRLNLLADATLNIKAGGALLMSGGTTDLDTSSFVVHDGENEIISATSEGVVIGADSIVANKYIGPILGTYPGGAFAWQGSFAATFGESGLPKYLITETTVNVPSGVYNEDVLIQGYTGAKLNINIAANTTINGMFSVVSCSNVEITGVSNTTCVICPRSGSANSSLFRAEYNGNVSINTLKLSGYTGRTNSSNGTHYGVYVYASRAQIRYSQIERTTCPIYADMSTVLIETCRGGTSGSDPYSIANLDAIRSVTASVVTIYSIIPLAVNSPVDNIYSFYGQILGTATPTASIGEYTPPSETVRNYSSTSCGRLTIPSSSTFSNWSTYSPRQGDISAEDYWGIWILPAITDYAIAKQAKVTITRGLAQGSSGAVTVNIRGHGQTGLPSGYYTPATANALFVDYGMTVSLERGASATILLPTAALNALKAGTLKGFGLNNSGSLAQMTDSISLEVTT